MAQRDRQMTSSSITSSIDQVLRSGTGLYRENVSWGRHTPFFQHLEREGLCNHACICGTQQPCMGGGRTRFICSYAANRGVRRCTKWGGGGGGGGLVLQTSTLSESQVSTDKIVLPRPSPV